MPERHRIRRLPVRGDPHPPRRRHTARHTRNTRHRIVRCTAITAFAEVCPLQEWPKVNTSCILCTDDRVISPDWSRQVSRERLGAPAIELAGSHSPMLSRPADLVEALCQLTADTITTQQEATA
ncbi:alpha/beta fold hydrolase [Rhodococcus sp. NPDC057529]|uniref:alpha/beta fold hydrolase n=1 Tax=Rhodococcus sp. NPDC057529 TaxID=3346158 RepID=UPI00367240CE